MWQESPSEDLVSHIAGSGSSISPPLCLHRYPQVHEAVAFLSLDCCTDSKPIPQIYSYPSAIWYPQSSSEIF